MLPSMEDKSLDRTKGKVGQHGKKKEIRHQIQSVKLYLLLFVHTVQALGGTQSIQ